MSARAHDSPRSVLPLPVRRGLSRVEAADYINVSPSKFDQLVKDGSMPQALKIGTRSIWDVRRIDDAFDRLPVQDGGGLIVEQDDGWDDYK